MEHFAFPGNIDFAADDQRIVMYYSWKAHVFIHLWNNHETTSMKQSVNQEHFPIQMTQNNKNKCMKILYFQPETPLQNAE